ncbi:MAG: gluconate 2-dehydrogenase subunit 3 family protein [Vicinamibacterales bacterium]
MDDYSRRAFLVWLGVCWPSIVAAQEHARRALKNRNSGNAPALRALSAEQAVEIEAIAAQILPTTESPGAGEAGAIYFIDHALATFDRARRRDYQRGLADLQARVARKFPPARKFSALDSPRQVEVLREIEQTPFFSMVHFHTVAGFLADPHYGGNRNQVGWMVLGFDNAPTHQPPFGYYDREG